MKLIFDKKRVKMRVGNPYLIVILTDLLAGR